MKLLWLTPLPRFSLFLEPYEPTYGESNLGESLINPSIHQLFDRRLIGDGAVDSEMMIGVLFKFKPKSANAFCSLAFSLLGEAIWNC